MGFWNWPTVGPYNVVLVSRNLRKEHVHGGGKRGKKSKLLLLNKDLSSDHNLGYLLRGDDTVDGQNPAPVDR